MKRSRYKYDVEVESDYRLSEKDRAWMYDNNITKYSWHTDENGQRYITFTNETDAVAFKLYRD